jgi:hypothetical protein
MGLLLGQNSGTILGTPYNGIKIRVRLRRTKE